MAFCSPGVGQAKAGYSQTVVMTGTGLGALLNNVPVIWAVPFAMLIAGVTYDLSQLCVNDPVALPVMTAADMLAVATPLADPVAYAAALQKFYNFFKYWAWFQFCECTVIATPAPSAPPAPPANLPQVNLTLPPTAAAACLHADSGVVTLPAQASKIIIDTLIPTSATSIRYTCTFIAATGTLAHMAWTLTHSATDDPSTSVLADSSPTTLIVGSVYTATVAVTTPGHFWFVQAVPQDGAVGDTAKVRVTVDVFCRQALPPSAGQCCEDPAILLALQQLQSNVQLLQRQIIPFAYLTGAVHAGLSGQGTIAVSSLLGVKVDLTTIPPTFAQQADVANYIFGVGWMSILTADGFIDERRVTRAHQLWMPELMSDATSFGYSFAPGIVATVTELLREP
jgi:hypothetical protein